MECDYWIRQESLEEEAKFYSDFLDMLFFGKEYNTDTSARHSNEWRYSPNYMVTYRYLG